jgi:predicted TIM-barrel fold metal-dependent hydrolase
MLDFGTLSLLMLLAAAPDRVAPVAPIVDYHQHLVSPAGAALLNHLSPSVELPQDVARLLHRVEDGWNDKAALADLYTEDSLVLDDDRPGWIRGRAEVAAYLSSRFIRAYRLTPLAFTSDGTTGHIAGFFTRGEGTSGRHIGYFYMGLAKGRDGAWRIAVENPTYPGPPVQETVNAEQLIGLLDAVGIQRAIVLSVAYWFDGPNPLPGVDAYAQMRAENDWTSREVARFPDRLVGFCSFNPLKEYALAELGRCANELHLKGLKLHFRGSGVDLKNPGHVEKVRRVFEAANRLRMPITVHVRADETYGREHAEIFLNQLLPAAPDIVVQIAHLWGGEAFSDSALAAYADAVSSGHPATKNLYFDVAESAIVAGGSDEILQTLARRIRQIGPRHVLYGSDSGHQSPSEGWEMFRTKVPLTDEEIRTIAGNVTSYLQGAAR